MIDRCHDETVDGVKYHIPGCIGCAVGGHERCTCLEKETKPELIRRVRALEYEVEQMKKTIQELIARKGR
jgi:hypothetical protein